MAFSIFGYRWKTRAQRDAASTEGAETIPGGCAVVKKTMPSRLLTDQKNPHAYIPAHQTDIRKRYEH